MEERHLKIIRGEQSSFIGIIGVKCLLDRNYILLGELSSDIETRLKLTLVSFARNKDVALLEGA